MKLHKNTRISYATLILSLMVLSSCGMFKRHTELDCMERAMYFESHRSSRDGMIAVGSVVMNRVESGQYPSTVCGVVAQKGQFAPGIMARDMNDRSVAKVKEAASAVLKGERHPMVGDAKFFHSANYRPRYDNIHYVLVTGGNAFYERRPTALVTQPVPPAPVEGITRR